VQVARSSGREECLPQLRTDFPVGLKGVNIRHWNTALEVALDILNVLNLLAINVARDIKIEVVLLDLVVGDHARIAGHFEAAVEDINDLVNVHAAETVLVAVLEVAPASIDHKDTLAAKGIALVNDDDAGRNTSAIEEVRRQADDALDVAPLDEVAPD